jgi:acyl-coenzyme A synthetase/AMP-(fatty) acid ligase
MNERLEKSFISNKDQVAIRHNEQSWTYAQVHSWRNQLSNDFCVLGLQSGMRVAVLVNDLPPIIVSMLACFQNRLVYSPIDSTWSAGRIHSMLTQTFHKSPQAAR